MIAPRETPEQEERRLQIEARTVCLGHLRHPETPERGGTSCRVEVTYEDDGYYRCGYFYVAVPSIEQTGDEDADLANHPATLAADTIAEQRPGYTVDDIYSA